MINEKIISFGNGFVLGLLGAGSILIIILVVLDLFNLR